MKQIQRVIVTRHPALVAYLKEIGLMKEGDKVITHATPDDVRDKMVIGVLPLSLAAIAFEVIEVPLNLPPEARGKELSIEEVRQYAGKPARYMVIKNN